MTPRRAFETLLILTVVLTSCKPIELSQSSLTLNVTPRHKLERLVLKTFDLTKGEKLDETRINSGLRTATTYLDKDTYCNELNSYGDDIPRTAEQKVEISHICETSKGQLGEISLLSLITDTAILFYKYDPNEMVEGLVEQSQTLTELLEPNRFYEVHVGIEGITREKNTTYFLQYWTDDSGKPTYRNWFTDDTRKQGKPQSIENL